MLTTALSKQKPPGTPDAWPVALGTGHAYWSFKMAGRPLYLRPPPPDRPPPDRPPLDRLPLLRDLLELLELL